jgi:hypothetical protein
LTVSVRRFDRFSNMADASAAAKDAHSTAFRVRPEASATLHKRRHAGNS